jgi:predicted PurR-regulated permease PerM
MTNHPSSSRRAMTWGGLAFVIAALYFAREVCIPLALALLFSFLLGPLVVRLRRIGLGRLPSVLITMAMTGAVVGLVTWLMASQIYDLAARLPQYQSNIQTKIRAFSKPGGGIIAKASRILHELSRDIENRKAAEATRTTPPAPKPIPVEVHEPEPTAPQLLRNLVSSLAMPLTTAGIVIVFVAFMLLNREDLRDRVIRLLGTGQLNLTTQALDDAAYRVSRFLLLQLMVNVCYGIPIAIALFFIGVPNPLLWGLMATLLRFIPYLGPWLAASMPCALAFAVDPGWGMLIGTLVTFVVMELITYNVLEPWLYGSYTGISPVAILGAAVFWTWLWGPVGLLLSTPLTVCVVVIGRYVPHLEFLSVVLGDEPVLTPEARFYQRLLAMNYDEAVDIAEQFAAEKSLAELYDEVFIPALTLVEADRHRGVLEPERERFIFDTTRELIQELPERLQAAKNTTSGEGPALPKQMVQSQLAVLVLPAADEADELAAEMLAQLLTDRGVAAKAVAAKALASERLEEVHKAGVSIVCVSAIPPGAIAPARYLCKRLRAEFSQIQITVGMWQKDADLPRLQQRIGTNLADVIVTRLPQAVEQISPAASVGGTAASSRSEAERPVGSRAIPAHGHA